MPSPSYPGPPWSSSSPGCASGSTSSVEPPCTPAPAACAPSRRSPSRTPSPMWTTCWGCSRPTPTSWLPWARPTIRPIGRIAGRTVGFVANQPQALAGTLDIAASQKGARFVRFCDAFNLPLVTLVDTPGFLPGKDLEWRGMIRHGAELAFAYAEATVPRVCVILRKAFGGAYIVMDSKGLGNDLCFAWPGAEIAVMGAEGAVQILHRRSSAEERARLQVEYAEAFLTPYQAAERGFVDAVIDPDDTRAVVADALAVLETRRESLPGRKHTIGPL